ncbi:MAG: preprotein translocase subunit SecG [Verrucomicrobia bacterium]|nr:preprotein translocase subunit SecG [Verrucomicrobiota bacterium]
MTFVIGLLLTVQALTCLFLILIVLMQPSKADGGLGAAFGGGTTDTLFGARTGNVLTKGTIWGATILFVTSVLLAILIAHQKPTSLVLDKVVTTQKSAEKTAATPASEKTAAPAKSAAPAEKAAEKPATTPVPAKK